MLDSSGSLPSDNHSDSDTSVASEPRGRPSTSPPAITITAAAISAAKCRQPTAAWTPSRNGPRRYP